MNRRVNFQDFLEPKTFEFAFKRFRALTDSLFHILLTDGSRKYRGSEAQILQEANLLAQRISSCNLRIVNCIEHNEFYSELEKDTFDFSQDPFSLMPVMRTVVESTLLFNYIYILPTDSELRGFLYLVWNYVGRMNKHQLHGSPLQIKEKACNQLFKFITQQFKK